MSAFDTAIASLGNGTAPATAPTAPKTPVSPQGTSAFDTAISSLGTPKITSVPVTKTSIPSSNGSAFDTAISSLGGIIKTAPIQQTVTTPAPTTSLFSKTASLIKSGVTTVGKIVNDLNPVNVAKKELGVVKTLITPQMPKQALGLPDPAHPDATNTVSVKNPIPEIGSTKILTNSSGAVIAPKNIQNDNDAINAVNTTQFHAKQLEQQKAAFEDEAKTLDTSNPAKIANFNARVTAFNTSGKTVQQNISDLSDQLDEYQASKDTSTAETKDVIGAALPTGEQKIEQAVGVALLAVGAITGVDELAGAAAVGTDLLLKGATEVAANAAADKAVQVTITKALTGGLIGTSIFTGLQKAEQGMAKNASDPEKLLLFTANLFASGGILYGASKAVPALGDALFQSYSEKYNLPKTIFINGEDVPRIMSEGEMSDLARTLGSDKGGVDVAKLKEAMKNGVTLEIPAEKITQISEKPYWTKIKSAFGIEPIDQSVKIEKFGSPTSVNEKGATPLQLPEGRTPTDVLHGEINDHIEAHGVDVTHQALQDNLGLDEQTSMKAITGAQQRNTAFDKAVAQQDIPEQQSTTPEKTIEPELADNIMDAYKTDGMTQQQLSETIAEKGNIEPAVADTIAENATILKNEGGNPDGTWLTKSIENPAGEEKTPVLSDNQQKNVETVPIEEKNTPASKAVKTGNERVESLTAKKIEAKAIEKKLITEPFESLSSHEKVVIEDQRTAIDKLYKEDPDRIMRIAMGEEKAPEGMLESIVYRKAVSEVTNGTDAHRLANSPFLENEVAPAAQTLRGMQEYGGIDEADPVNKIRETNKVLENNAKEKIEKGKTVKQVKKEFVKKAEKTIKAKTPKVSFKKVQDFINMLEC